jgi:hypothetical protein
VRHQDRAALQQRPHEGYVYFHAAYKECDKAAKEKGADQTADVNCLKFLLSSRKDCWPCICQAAKQEGWKIKGCDLIEALLKNLQTINLRG